MDEVGRVMSLRIESNKSLKIKSIKFCNVVLTLLFIIISGLSERLFLTVCNVNAISYKIKTVNLYFICFFVKVL